MTAIDPVTLPSWCTAPPSALRKRHPAELENAKAQFLGKAGRVTELMKGMGQLGIDEKKTRGAAINQAKQAIEAALTARRQALPTPSWRSS
jgi:phenylalanyl-tRNA synthetase alpha subunit